MMDLKNLSINIWRLELKKDKGTDYVFSRKSKRVLNYKRKPSYTAFLHRINLSNIE